MKQADWMATTRQRAIRKWLHLGRGARASIIGVAILALVLVPIVQHRAYNGKEWLLGGATFSPPQIVRMESAWAIAGLGDYRIVDGKVQIPVQLRAKYLSALVAAHAMPQSLTADVTQAFDQLSVLESPAQRQARLELAKDHELGSYLKSMSGIEDASVRFDEAKSTGLRSQSTVKAMVVIRPSEGAVLRPDKIHTIRVLVASSRVGLSPEDVTVTDLGSGHAYRGPLADAVREVAASALPDWERDHEFEWEKKISRILAAVPGSQVEADVRLRSDGIALQQVKISVSIPDAYVRQYWNSQLQTGHVSARNPTADELGKAETDICEKVTQLIQKLSPQSDNASSTMFASPVPTTTVEVAISKLSPTSAGFDLRQKFNWQEPNAMVAVFIVIMALGALLIFVGFLRDITRGGDGGKLATPSTKAALKKGDAKLHEEVATLSSGGVWPLDGSLPDGALEGNPDEIQKELTNLMRDNPKAAADLLRRWAQEAA